MFGRTRPRANYRGILWWAVVGKRREEFFESVTLIRCAALVRCRSSHKTNCERVVGMEESQTVERRGRTRGEKRDLTSKGVLKGPSCVEQKKGKEGEFGGAAVGGRRISRFAHCCAPANHGDASSFGSMPESSAYCCVINAPCPCTQNATLSFGASPTARDCTPVPPSDLPRSRAARLTRLATREGWISVLRRTIG